MVKCAVIGCGLMGVKIAGDLAFHGHRVKMHDNGMAALNSVHKRLEEDRKELIDEGILLQSNFTGQVLCMSRLEETVSDADFIFEAVPDNLALKQDLFERISHCCKEDAILATNTLRLDVNDIFCRTIGPQRTLGLRFLFPVYYVDEVEVTTSRTTCFEHLDRVKKFLANMGRTMFFRSGTEPLILSEEQREEKRARYSEHVRQSGGLSGPMSSLPQLGASGSGHGGVGLTPRSPRAIEMDLSASQRSSTSFVDPECAICLDRQRDCLLAPCHHLILCSNCAKLLHSRKDFCPVCRQQIVDVIKVYHS